MELTDIIFLIFSLVTVTGAVAVVAGRNPVYCVFSLIVSMAGLAAVFYLLSAPFIAAMQIIVYAGSIVVLFLFVIMLLGLKREEMGGEMPVEHKIFAVFLCVLLLIVASAPLMKTLIFKEDVAFGAVPSVFGTTAFTGYEIFACHELAYELVAVLLIIALVGAIYLAKKRNT